MLTRGLQPLYLNFRGAKEPEDTSTFAPLKATVRENNYQATPAASKIIDK